MIFWIFSLHVGAFDLTVEYNGLLFIADGKYENWRNLSSVVIEDGYTVIGARSFKNTTMTSITLPNTLQEIRNAAFQDTNLQSVVIPEGTLRIDSSAFYKSPNLRSISLPSTLKKMEHSAFAFPAADVEVTLAPNNPVFTLSNGIMLFDNNGTCCVVFIVDKFTKVTLPEAATVIDQQGCAHIKMCEEIECKNIVRIGTYAFRNDISLKKITFGSPIETIGGQMVEGCKNLTTIDIDGTSDYFYSENGVLYTRSGDTIEMFIYPAAQSMTTFNVNKDLLTIESSPFYQSQVRKFTVQSGHPTLCIYKDCVYNKDKTVLLACPPKVNTTVFKFPSTLTEIGDRAMYGLASKFSSLTIPEGVTHLGDQWMAISKQVLAITLPSTLVTIGKKCFHDTRFTTLVVPSKVTEIPTAFCTWNVKLETVTIQGSVTYVGADAFSHCTLLNTINIPDTVTEIGSNAFASCPSMTTLKLPASLEKLGATAFSGCNNIGGNVIVPACCKIIDKRSFYMCDAIELVTIVNCNTEVGSEALFATRGSIQSTCIM